MAEGKGYASKAAFKIETGDFRTAIALNGAAEYNQIHFISEGVSPDIAVENSVMLDGSAGVKTSYQTLKKYGGDLVVEGWYRGLESLLICALGMSHQDNSPVDEGSGAYRHYIELSNDLSTRAFNEFEMATPSGNAIRRGTLGFEKSVSIWEFVSTMFNSVTMQVTPQRVIFTFNVVPEDLHHDSGTNSASTNWAVPANGTQIYFSDATLYLKARDEFTITSSNDVLTLNESGDVSLDIDDGTYTGYELAQAIQIAANASALTGTYTVTYSEELRKFKIVSTVSFFVVSTGDMNVTVGFSDSANSADQLENTSIYQAVPDSFAAFDSGDQVGFNSLSWTLENNLATDDQDSESSSKILEPERNDMRSITGSIEIPRYEDDDKVKAVNGFTTYAMHLKFTGDLIGGANYEELNVYFPQIKFTNVQAPIGGAELIKQTLNFEVQNPVNFLDFVNFNFVDYMYRSIGTAAGNCQSMGAYKDGLYCGCSGGIIMKMTDGAWASSCDFGANTPLSIMMYDGNLYAGTTAGEIFEYDGSSWSASCDVGAGQIINMTRYDDNLYVLENTTGKVFEYNGSAWSLSCDTVSTSACEMIVFQGSLYVAGYDSNLRVFKYNGSAWSSSCDFGASPGTYLGMCLLGSKLYLLADVGAQPTLFSFDGTTWSSEGNLTNTARYAIEYKGNILYFEHSATGDIYAWDFDSSSDYVAFNINADLTAFNTIVYDGRLMLPVATTTPKFIEPLKEILITIQNENATNPL